MEKKYVDIIASGYEWTCPNCGRLNNEYAWIEDLECHECHKEYKASLPEHVYD